MGLPSYMRSVVDRNVVMRRIPVFRTVLTTRHAGNAGTSYAHWLASIAIKRNWRMIGFRIPGSFTSLALLRLCVQIPLAQVGPVVTVQLLLYYAPLLTLVTNLCLANRYWISHDCSNSLPYLFTPSERTRICPVPWAEHCFLILWLDFWTEISNFSFC
jgi:hypothetical protein